MNTKAKTIIGILVVGVLGIGLIVWGKSLSNKKDSNLTSREVALTCTTDMATKFHIHPELTIVINGENVLVPLNLGIKPTCMTSIHTHEEVGVIHVEAPIQKDFTLGDFFAVWGKEFNRNQILEYTRDDSSTISITVNGATVDTYENTILKDGDKIIISYQKQ